MTSDRKIFGEAHANRVLFAATRRKRSAANAPDSTNSPDTIWFVVEWSMRVACAPRNHAAKRRIVPS